MTQTKLAEKIGVTRQRISKLLNIAKAKFGRHAPSLSRNGDAPPKIKANRYQ